MDGEDFGAKQDFEHFTGMVVCGGIGIKNYLISIMQFNKYPGNRPQTVCVRSGGVAAESLEI